MTNIASRVARLEREAGNAGRGRLITIQSEGASEAEVDAFLQSQGIVVDPCKDVLVHLCNHFLDRNEQPVVTPDRGLRLLYTMEKRS